MRQKQDRIVISFHTTQQAIATEKLCMQEGIAGRLIPLPTEISAGCGLAWSAPPEAEGPLRKSLQEAGIEWAGWTVLSI